MELTTTHRSTVTEDQIDHLGHMNVRYYGVNARAATDAFVASLGSSCDLAIEPVEIYTRHLREQLAGASLEVRTGVLDAGSGWLRLYHELRNTETGDVAATFVHRLHARPEDAGAAWPPGWESIAAGEIPDYGRPRSIDLDTDPLTAAPTLDFVQERELAIRKPRVIEPDLCDPSGRYAIEHGPFLMFGGEPIDDAFGPMLQDGPEGEVIGWAAMESRMSINQLPTLGTTIQTFSATLAVTDKATVSVMWVYDLDSRDMLVSFENVSLAFDTKTRRAVSIPDSIRSVRARNLLPELAPKQR